MNFALCIVDLLVRLQQDVINACNTLDLSISEDSWYTHSLPDATLQ